MSSHLFVLLIVLFSITNILVTSQTTITSSATLTTSSTTSSIANITLVPNGAYNTITSNSWRCDNPEYNSFCVYLRIFNNKNCINGTETISIKLHGSVVSGDVDIYALFSLENSESMYDFFTLAHDWDGGWTYQNGVHLGGVFIAPYCNTHMNTRNNIFTILDNIAVNVWSNRAPMAGGTISNWKLLNTSRVGASTSPLTYTFVNDLMRNQFSTYFDASTITQQSCTYTNTFDTTSGNDYIVVFLGDAGTLAFTQFDVNVSCTVCGVRFI